MVDIVRDEQPEIDRYIKARPYIELDIYAGVLLDYATNPDQRFGDIVAMLAGASVLYEGIGLFDKQKPVDTAIDKIINDMEEYIVWLEDELYACSGKKKERPMFVLEKGQQS